MSIPSIISKHSIKVLSGLANNNDSIMPMVFKDTISNGAIVYTYGKEGTKDDVREKTIEEFGTGAIWLFGIPAVKKLIDKTVYPFLKLDPGFDVRTLKDEKRLKTVKNLLKDSDGVQKEVFSTLNEKNSVLKNFTNEKLYKGLFAGKFVTATALSALALSKIIKYKQKTTQKRIERDFYKNNASKTLVNKKISASPQFCSNAKKSSNPSFKGASAVADLFMYNPIANTFILDGVITGIRFKDSRKGERFEVGFKEIFQLIFIYALAKPIEFCLETLGKALGMPIELSPEVLFDKNLKKDLPDAKNSIKQILDDDNIFKTAESQKSEKSGIFKAFNKRNKKAINGKILNNPEALIEKLYGMKSNDALIKLLEKNGAISLIEDKNGIKSINLMKHIDDEQLITTFKNINSLSSKASNISKIKAYKTVSVIGNVIIAALSMGVLQPKLNILLRKMLNNGDNRNQAIVEQEKQMHKAVANS